MLKQEEVVGAKPCFAQSRLGKMAEEYHNRKHPRLAGFNYTAPGGYFTTVCTENRSHSLGRIVNGNIELTELGWLAEQVWLELPTLFPRCALLDHVVMPNHIHGIIVINPVARVGEAWLRPESGNGTKPGSLGALIQAYKSRVTRQAKQLGLISGSIWQRGYHEHVIRNDGDLEMIQEYIINNPRRWELDKENIYRSGLNPFYRNLENPGRSTASPLRGIDSTRSIVREDGRSVASPLRVGAEERQHG